MCKFTVLLTSDKESIIVTHGEPVEGAPSFCVNLSNSQIIRTLTEAIEDTKSDIEKVGALLWVAMGGGPYAPEVAAQYSPVKVAEFEINQPGLHESFEALTTA